MRVYYGIAKIALYTNISLLEQRPLAMAVIAFRDAGSFKCPADPSVE